MSDATNVCVSWRDELGAEVGVEIDGLGVLFDDGYAIFYDLNEKQYKIPFEDLLGVGFI